TLKLPKKSMRSRRTEDFPKTDLDQTKVDNCLETLLPMVTGSTIAWITTKISKAGSKTILSVGDPLCLKNPASFELRRKRLSTCLRRFSGKKEIAYLT